MTYCMTSTDVRYWEDCESVTERKAKMEATYRFGSGFQGSTYRIGIMGMSGLEVEEVASKHNVPGARWVAAE